MGDSFENCQNSHPILELLKSLVYNEDMSDCKFLVGIEKKEIYAHKTLLALMSPVFKVMFYADNDLKMDNEIPIEIPDLTPIGFTNMIKFIYGHEFNSVGLSELYETYLAGNKYLVFNFVDSLTEYIKNVLNISNCLLIYEQLIRFENKDIMNSTGILKLIYLNFREILNSDSFFTISEETLISILSLDPQINEIDILKACHKWVQAECPRRCLEVNRLNMQKVFKTLKKYVYFNLITFNQLKEFGKIEDIMDYESMGELLSKLLAKQQ